MGFFVAVAFVQFVISVVFSSRQVDAAQHPVREQLRAVFRQSFWNGGLTYDPCLSSSNNCISPRLCAEVNGECTATSNACVCVPPDRFTICNDSSDCVLGERCITALTHQYCVSCAVAERSNMTTTDSGDSCSQQTGSSATNDDDPTSTLAPSGNGTSDEDQSNTDGAGIDEEDDNDNNEASGNEDNRVCIAVNHLQHLSASDLVFSKHRKATVLCDSQGSCATPGHIVMIHQEPMTMRSYCALHGVECGRNIKWVNSPRYGSKTRIASHTEGLEFTALAAKYESWVEQKVLGMLIRVGL